MKNNSTIIEQYCSELKINPQMKQLNGIYKWIMKRIELSQNTNMYTINALCTIYTVTRTDAKFQHI